MKDDKVYDYILSLRNEHRKGCSAGRNALVLDDRVNGTTIFIPFKLHKPIELFFVHRSKDSIMCTIDFTNLVVEFGLFPKFQNARKRDDIIGYIISKSERIDKGFAFEDFLYALYLLAKYRASVLHVTEQCAFNHILSTLANTKTENTSASSESICLARCDEATTDFQKETENTGDLSSHTESPSYLPHSSGDAVGNHSKEELKGNSDAKPGSSRPAEGREEASERGEGDVCSTAKLLEKDMEIETIRAKLAAENRSKNDMELEYLDKVHKLELDANELRVVVNAKARETENLEKDLEYERSAKDALDKSLRNEIEELRGEVEALNLKLGKYEEYKLHAHEMQKLLKLEPEHEAKLYSIFSVYKDGEPIDGELVISEDQCITFCQDFGLGDVNSARDYTKGPIAKQAYDKVHKYTFDGGLTYIIFKEFLMHISTLFNPNLYLNNAFIHIVSELLFLSSTSSGSGGAEAAGMNNIYVTDTNPWRPANENDDIANLYRAYDNNSHFIDVQGKVWFDQKEHTADNTQNIYKGERKLTPRFN